MCQRCTGPCLAPADRDLHWFVWREDQTSALSDYRMTCVTFGVAASPFAAVQSLYQTAVDFEKDLPLAKQHVFQSFYIDNCLAGEDLRSLLLRKWRSSSTDVMNTIPKELHGPSRIKDIAQADEHQKALGLYWDCNHDLLYVSVGCAATNQVSTKRSIVTDIARTFDVLGWYAPSTITMKILFQHLWELKFATHQRPAPAVERSAPPPQE